MSFESVTLSREELLNAIRHDCVTFLSFYLGDELDLEIPDFHEEIWDEFLAILDEVNNPEFIVGILKRLIAVPREHAKTTLIKLAVILFMRYSRLGFTAYVSKTFSVALAALKDVKDWLTSPTEIEVYGRPTITKASDNEGLFMLTIGLPNGSQKPIIMKAFGSQTQIRGTIIQNKRPDLLIYDDIEDRDTLEPRIQEKLDTWALGTALKSMAKRGVVIFIGNMLADTSLLARLSKDPTWRPVVFGSIIRTSTGLRALWEGRWTLEALIADYMEYRKNGLGHIWEAEMMNLTHESILGESLTNALRPPVPSPEEVEAGFLVLDPAFGLNSWNDESAITTHVRVKNAQIPIVARTMKGRWKESEVFDRMLEESYYWGINTWVIESVAAQRLLIPLFTSFCALRNIPQETIVYMPLVATKESKATRIVAFRSAVAVGAYGIVDSEQELVDKLEKYTADSKEHDDLCDSAAYGTIVWANYGQAITARGRQDIAGLILATLNPGGRPIGDEICPF